MRILHTADWHLGKRLEQSERTDEHQAFLDWLILTLDAQRIDVLIIAGDIFDTGSPSNTALELYYAFLRKVKDTCCEEVIIIGGNHDSISTLNAPQSLLKYFNVHIVGGVPEEFTDQIIQINNAAAEPVLLVCAVPFLRDRDIRLSIAGETTLEREQRLKQGITDHYHRFIPHITPFKDKEIPVIATGHLFAAGSSTSDSEKEIHVGNLGQIGAEQFPEAFDYIALGHIHRPQKINQVDHIRYSGSPIPLSFSETSDRKIVLVIEFEGPALTLIDEVEVPCTRRLLRIKGDLLQVKNKLTQVENTNALFPAWIEIQVETNAFIYELEDELQALIAGNDHIERLFIRQVRTGVIKNLNEQTQDLAALNELDPETVFQRKCESTYPGEDHSSLMDTFKQVMSYMQEKEQE